MRAEEEQVEALRLEAERAKAEAQAARDAVELERGEMLKGFSEVRVALEVRLAWGGAPSCLLTLS